MVGAGFLPLLRLLPRSTIAAALTQPGELRFFDPHQAAVVEEATARLIPGPSDDPAEAGFPGAREAGVVHYIDLFLSAFDEDPPRIYATGPWSGRSGGEDHMDGWVPLARWQEERWRQKIDELKDRYRDGIALLDREAGGDFTTVTPERRDEILISIGGDAGGFRRLLFEHAIEGMYAAPEYGGNKGLVGWTGIDYRGDSAPLGYPPDELAAITTDPVPPGVELPFPPDMATAGTDDPLGGQTLPVTPAAFHDLVPDPEAFFVAAEPGIARRGPYSRGRKGGTR